MSFYMRVVECTGSVALSKAIEKTHVLIFNWLYDVSTKLSLPARWHGVLMEALGRNDPDVAEKAMRRHINYGLRQIQETLAQQLGPDTSQLPFSLGRTLNVAPRAWRKKKLARDTSSASTNSN